MPSWRDDIQKAATSLREADKVGTLKVTTQREVCVAQVVNSFGGIRFHGLHHFVRTLKAGLQAAIFVIYELSAQLSEKCSTKLRDSIRMQTMLHSHESDEMTNTTLGTKSSANLTGACALEEMAENGVFTTETNRSNRAPPLSWEDLLLVFTQLENSKFNQELLMTMLSEINKEDMELKIAEVVLAPKTGMTESVARLEINATVRCSKYFPPLFDFDSNICIKLTEFSGLGVIDDIYYH